MQICFSLIDINNSFKYSGIREKKCIKLESLNINKKHGMKESSSEQGKTEDVRWKCNTNS